MPRIVAAKVSARYDQGAGSHSTIDAENLFRAAVVPANPRHGDSRMRTSKENGHEMTSSGEVCC